MFTDILKSGVPLLAVHYRDTVYTKLVMDWYAESVGKTALELQDPSIPVNALQEDTLYWRVAEEATSGRSASRLHGELMKRNSQFIYVNLQRPPRAYLPVSDVPTPTSLVEDILKKHFKNAPDMVEEMLPAVGGLTLQEVVEIIRITSAKFGKITPARVAKTRGLILPVIAGLSMVDTTMPFYLPNDELAQFAADEKHYFFHALDPRIRPRGALFDGIPGVGKTQGAKYLAAQWGVPLYRMDATVNSKWHGESESNLQRILQQAASEEPCVLLIDEAEKIFGDNGGGSNGIKDKLLSLMLWYMQENPAKVFLIMTTNDRSIIPPELLRPGRLDRQFVFKGVVKDDAHAFIMSMIKSFKDVEGIPDEQFEFAIKKQISALYPAGTGDVAHANLTGAAMKIVKTAMVNQEHLKPTAQEEAHDEDDIIGTVTKVKFGKNNDETL
jgi:hypothetical protein